ncbi:MAG: TRAP transporter TatT component family protein [Thermoanaerobaculales bacterium]|nr:TRAP transporter TatT component family protein [Thermoanaerobaculales bacterium]
MATLRKMVVTATVIGTLLIIGGCSAVTSSITSRMSAGLATSILNQNDPETVRQGAPAYLLMIDGFIAEDPDNADVLLTAARLYSSYAAAFVDDPQRAALMALKARDYGFRGLCLTNNNACGMSDQPYEEFSTVVDGLGDKDIDAAYVAAMAWATWVQANSEDWVAVADKARVEALMQRVVALDEGYRQGSAYLYLGVLATLLPEALGGKPEEGRAFFERSIDLSGGRDLMAKVLIARDYARLVFDRELHDRLLLEVIEADAVAPGLTLSNTLAQHEARRLLDDSQDYFGD